jgi:osmotically-inducible protein OsmY
MTSKQAPGSSFSTIARTLAVCALVVAGLAGETRIAAQATVPPPAAPRRNIAGPGDYALREKLVHLYDSDEGLRSEGFRVILVNGGVVFSGNISSCARRRRALMIAATLRGVVNVTDEMTVPRGEAPDEEMAKAATSLLSQAADDLGLKDLDAQVADGVLTLQGTARDLTSRARAEEIAGAVPGINRISNRLRPANAPSGTDDTTLLLAVINYLGDFHNFSLSSDLKVKVDRGVVVLTGRTALYLGRLQAALAASQVKGVVRVENQIKIDPSLTARRSIVQAGT